jgi:hypothetical protein
MAATVSIVFFLILNQIVARSLHEFLSRAVADSLTASMCEQSA